MIHTLIENILDRFIRSNNKYNNKDDDGNVDSGGSWSTFPTDDIQTSKIDKQLTLTKALQKTFQVELPDATFDSVPGAAMDAKPTGKIQFNWSTTVPDAQVLWYASQGFIGYQLAATIAQNWLIGKACLMPAKDAIRNGYEITVNDGTDVDPDILDAMRKADVLYNINGNMVQLIQMGRIFGIRIAMFIVDSNDPEYYSKPFNPDGIKPGSYKGITQIDPYWITPELDGEASANPAAPDFYEPTWWRVNAQLIHRTHLIIYRTEEVPDILKPTYIYGGIPIPQKIYARVYAAERTADEAPNLAMTKRMDVMNVDLSAAAAKQKGLEARLETFAAMRNNYGVKVIGLNDQMNQFDTSLNDLDVVIMTQYQIVAAAANVPAVKLLGTSPKGFNSTGEHEEANYHEELESIQAHDLTPFLERHYLLLLRSEIAPKFKISPFDISIEWNPLDAMTAKEEAELNKLKADTDAVLSNVGAIDGQDSRDRIVIDPKSGYNGLSAEAPVPEEETEGDPGYGENPTE